MLKALMLMCCNAKNLLNINGKSYIFDMQHFFLMQKFLGSNFLSNVDFLKMNLIDLWNKVYLFLIISHMSKYELVHEFKEIKNNIKKTNWLKFDGVNTFYLMNWKHKNNTKEYKKYRTDKFHQINSIWKSIEGDISICWIRFCFITLITNLFISLLFTFSICSIYWNSLKFLNLLKTMKSV